MANQKFKTKVQADAGVQLSAETASKVAVVDSSKELKSSSISITELETLSGVSSAIQGQINAKAPLASPAFTGTVTGITKAMVDLANVDNTSDANKPVSSAAQAALDLKAPLASPTFTGTVAGISKEMVGLGSVDNTSDAAKPVSTAQQAAIDLKADLASPTFTGTVSGISKAMVGLSNVDNTADASKPVSSAQSAAIALKLDASEKGAASGVATLDANSLIPISQIPPAALERLIIVANEAARYGLTLSQAQIGDTVKDIDTGLMYFIIDDAQLDNAAGYAQYTAGTASAISWGGVTGTPTTLSGYGITDYSAAAKAAAVADSISNAVTDVAPSQNAVYDALALKADLASPSFTGTVSGISKEMVGLGSVDNTADSAKPVSTAQQAALDLKAPLASPSFTGTVTGISKAMVGLSSVDDVQQMPMAYLDVDAALAANSDAKVPSQKAVKAYVAAQIGAAVPAGDISHSSFSAANAQVSAASITGFAFAAASVRSFKALVSVSIDATSPLEEAFELIGIQKASGFDMAISSVGDDSGVVLSITSAGQIQYVSSSVPGFVSSVIKFRAISTIA